MHIVTQIVLVAIGLASVFGLYMIYREVEMIRDELENHHHPDHPDKY